MGSSSSDAVSFTDEETHVFLTGTGNSKSDFSSTIVEKGIFCCLHHMASILFTGTLNSS
jgi:hypothetical protein